MTLYRLVTFTLMVFVIMCCVTNANALMLDRLQLPKGFSITVFAANVPNARQITRGSNGVIYVGTRREGVVYAVTDSNDDGVADDVVTIASDLFMPAGVAYRDGTLYVAEVDRILAYDDIDQRLASPPKARIVYDKLPKERHHGWKFIDFGPDGKLYIPVGAPCNVCKVADPYGTILRLDIGSGETEIVARGVRNSVGFAWHPHTEELWFADNGRDMLGDNRPPGELNRVTAVGEHYGFPFVHGGDFSDPDFGEQRPSIDFVKPALQLDAHVAPLGLNFYQGKLFPKSHRQSLFVAEHGSWNRTKKSGYRVMQGRFDNAGQITSYEPFITGWLVGQAHWGRPVDFEPMPDGSLLLSDDHAGVIYRISYMADDKN